MYQKVIDIWEGDTNLDFAILIANGVKGAVVRLNSINGGLHKDDLFDRDWEKALAFLVRAPYFVYNPWVSGAENYKWLMVNLPAGYKGIIFGDVEVKKDGYAPSTYASEVANFIALVSKTNLYATYTGEWFLPYCSSWGKGPYWWAAYPYSVYPASVETWTWEALEAAINKLTWSFPKAPGTVFMWQFTADRLILPGFGVHAVDLNIFNGTEDQLIAFFGGSNPVIPVSEPVVVPVEDPVVKAPSKYVTLQNMILRTGPGKSNSQIGSVWANTVLQDTGNSSDPDWIQVVGYVCKTLNNEVFLKEQ